MEATEPIAPMLRWMGGKTKLAKLILNIFPKHTCSKLAYEMGYSSRSLSYDIVLLYFLGQYDLFILFIMLIHLTKVSF
jgi:hypothetical protein